MTYDEWIEDNTLFDEILNLIDDDDLNEIDTRNMDMVFSLLYGDRKVIHKLHKYDVTDVSEMLVTLYGKKWTDTYDLLYNEVVKGQSSNVIVSDKGKVQSKRTIDRDNENNVSAYNDESYSPQSESAEITTDDNLTDTDNSKTTETKSLWAVQQQLWLLRNDIIDIIIDDVQNFITVKIY